MNNLTLSIIIPVYNEESYLGTCLDAIAAQTEKPNEVIVVDNNSTDKSVEIAKSYSFVKIMHEKRQGQVFAQAVGFNAAESDILGRIDADTIIAPNWVSEVKGEFLDHSGVVAVSGSGYFRDRPLGFMGSPVFAFYQQTLGKLIAGHSMMWGANCAMRRSVWEKVKNKVHYRADIWEDYDMSFFIAEFGEIKFVKGMTVDVSLRSGSKSIAESFSYQFRFIRTYKLHRGVFRAFLLLVIWCSLVIFLPLFWLDKILVWLRKMVKSS
jgi:glycosyltransferase involved in cell wall biosynthesis